MSGQKQSAILTAKQLLAKTSLLALGAAFEISSKYSQEVKDIVATWPEDLAFTLGILPDGPYVTIKREGDVVKNMGLKKLNPDLSILFKNVDAALLVFTGQIGTPTAQAQKRFIVQGNLTDTMKVARTMELVQMFLFPGIILNKTFKNPPKLTRDQWITKAKVMAMLTPGLVTGALK